MLLFFYLYLMFIWIIGDELMMLELLLCKVYVRNILKILFLGSFRVMFFECG